MLYSKMILQSYSFQLIVMIEVVFTQLETEAIIQMSVKDKEKAFH